MRPGASERRAAKLQGRRLRSHSLVEAETGAEINCRIGGAATKIGCDPFPQASPKRRIEAIRVSRAVAIWALQLSATADGFRL